MSDKETLPKMLDVWNDRLKDYQWEYCAYIAPENKGDIGKHDYTSIEIDGEDTVSVKMDGKGNYENTIKNIVQDNYNLKFTTDIWTLFRLHLLLKQVFETGEHKVVDKVDIIDRYNGDTVLPGNKENEN